MPIREFKYIYTAHVFVPCKGVTLRDDSIAAPHTIILYHYYYYY